MRREAATATASLLAWRTGGRCASSSFVRSFARVLLARSFARSSSATSAAFLGQTSLPVPFSTAPLTAEQLDATAIRASSSLALKRADPQKKAGHGDASRCGCMDGLFSLHAAKGLKNKPRMGRLLRAGLAAETSPPAFLRLIRQEETISGRAAATAKNERATEVGRGEAFFSPLRAPDGGPPLRWGPPGRGLHGVVIILYRNPVHPVHLMR